MTFVSFIMLSEVLLLKDVIQNFSVEIKNPKDFN